MAAAEALKFGLLLSCEVQPHMKKEAAHPLIYSRFDIVSGERGMKAALQREQAEGNVNKSPWRLLCLAVVVCKSENHVFPFILPSGAFELWLFENPVRGFVYGLCTITFPG